ncbi:MAG: lysophospholipid acyltransferase family protein [Deltaproteobacteria bacterium]
MIKQLSRLAIKFGIIPLAHYLVRMYMALVSIEVVNEKEGEGVLDYLKSGQKMIGAIWHQRIFIVMGYARRFQMYQPAVMISQSRDGEMIADIYRRFHFRPVRGSSSRGGREALAAMIADLAQNQFAVHVLDGPRGPRGVVKPGLIVMAQASGVPIFPFYITVDRAWVLKSWDRTLIPKPFSRVFVRWGRPFHVPKHLDEAGFETIRKEIEQHMKENQTRDDRNLGWEDLF